MNELTPFGKLPIDERVALFRAQQEGAVIQVYWSPSWHNCPNPTWSPEAMYRTAPEPASINWDHVAPEWIAMAMDDDGEWYLCTEVPYKKERFWDADDDAEWLDPAVFASFKPGTCDWRESLVLRPQVHAMKIGDSVKRFTNFYECACGTRWEDEHDCTCDDRCPACNASISPYRSEDL